jgi:hypothetical protein
VTDALSLPPTPAGDRHPTALSDTHAVLAHTVVPTLGLMHPLVVPYPYPFVSICLLPVWGWTNRDHDVSLGVSAEKALSKKCDCTPKDMNTVIDLCNRGRSLQMTVDSLIHVVTTGELYPNRNVELPFISPPWTETILEPVEGPWFGNNEVMYGAS